MEENIINSDYLRGHINTIILKSLINGEKYGLEIIKDIETNSNGSFILKQPSLYSALKRLESNGFISSYWKDSEIGGKRHYYSITTKGTDVYNTSQNEWTQNKQMIDSLISPNIKAGQKRLDNEVSKIANEINETINEIKSNLEIKQLNTYMDKLENGAYLENNNYNTIKVLVDKDFTNNINSSDKNFTNTQSSDNDNFTNKNNINDKDYTNKNNSSTDFLAVFLKDKAFKNYETASAIENDQFSFLDKKENFVGDDLSAFKNSLKELQLKNYVNENKPENNTDFVSIKIIDEKPIIVENMTNSDAVLLIKKETESDSQFLPNTKAIKNDAVLLSRDEKIYTAKELKEIEIQKNIEEERLKQEEETKLPQKDNSKVDSDAVFIKDTYIPKSKAEEQAILNNIYFKSSENNFESEKINSENSDIKEARNNDLQKNIIESNLEDIKKLSGKKQYIINSYVKNNASPALSDKFIKYGKFSLIKNLLLGLFVSLFVAGGYVTFYFCNIIPKNMEIYFIITGAIGFLPFIFSLINFAINPKEKKAKASIKLNFFIEFAVFIIGCLIIYAINVLFSNSITNIYDLPYFIAPVLVLINLFTNHIIVKLLKNANYFAA